MTPLLFIGVIVGYFLRPAIDKMLADFKAANKKRPAVKTNSKPSVKCIKDLAGQNGAKVLQEP